MPSNACHILLVNSQQCHVPVRRRQRSMMFECTSCDSQSEMLTKLCGALYGVLAGECCGEGENILKSGFRLVDYVKYQSNWIAE